MKRLFVISILILISLFIIANLSAESMERRIVSNAFLYSTATSCIFRSHPDTNSGSIRTA